MTVVQVRAVAKSPKDGASHLGVAAASVSRPHLTGPDVPVCSRSVLSFHT